MEINIKAKDYLEELRLMCNQWNQETDLYPWIYMLLQMGEVAHVSIRDIHSCLKNRSPLFYGLVGAPDFVILDKNVILQEYSDKNKEYDIEKHKEIKNITCLRGCVEIKKLYVELCIKEFEDKLKQDKNTDSSNEKIEFNKNEYQIIGHLLWYGKVLYTNGLQWEFLEWKNREEYLRVGNLEKTKKTINILKGINKENLLNKCNITNVTYNDKSNDESKNKLNDETNNLSKNNSIDELDMVKLNLNVSITKICDLGNHDDIRNNKIPGNFKQEWSKLIKFLKENDFWYQ